MNESSVFTYYIAERVDSAPEMPVTTHFGKYTVLTDSHTPFSYSEKETRACALYGLVTNVITGTSENIAEDILKNCSDMQDVIAYEKRLGGKYILLFKDREQYYILGDATCSIPVFYTTEGDFVCSGNYQWILNAKKYSVDSEYSAIRRSGNISQAMPYDITPCREIKQLIPNHYLLFGDKTPTRFVNFYEKQNVISVEKATEIVLPMIENLFRYYASIYKLYCPITSGRDSRVVLAFLMSEKDLTCYTIKHPEHREDEQDIIIPAELCRKNNLRHELLHDTVVSQEMQSEMDALLGKENYSLRTLQIAQTIKEHYWDGAIINGDIIGQVGKCSLHRDIPEIFATPAYFRCKLHNYSNGAKKQLKKWLEEISASGEKVNTFDLFSVENRMGRWAGQENLIYNTVGQIYLNIFNSRSIIYTWTSVARAKRKGSLLHIDLIRERRPSLLNVPFERDEHLIVKISKATGLLYLVSSYAKYYLESFKFRRNLK